MKKLISVLIICSIFICLCSCKKEETKELKIGLVTVTSNIDDDSITQAVWEGIQAASEQFTISYEHVQADNAESSFDCVKSLYEHGCRIIVATEYILSDTIKAAQKEYSDCYFICIDFALSSPSNNTINITFSEQEAGFIAGITAALKVQNGRFAAILGMDIPSARKYSNGYSFGIKYANQQLGTSVILNEDDIIFIGSYNDPLLAKKLSTDFYSSGVKCIFSDGGKTSEGIFHAAKSLRTQYSDIWVIGNATDKYNKGLFLDNHSVTLTSAINRYDIVMINIISDYINGKIKGGKIISYGASEQGIGLPKYNPNLSSDIIEKCNDALHKIVSGSIVIPDTENLLN